MTGYSDSPEADRDYGMREAANEPPIEMLLTDEELAEYDKDFEQIAEELQREYDKNLTAAMSPKELEILEILSKKIQLLTSIELLREDSDALRAYTSRLIHAIMLWVEQRTPYSNRIQQLIASGDERKLYEFIRDSAKETKAINSALIDSLAMDWRIALLTSPDMVMEHLTKWFPEYADRARVVAYPEAD